jgi:hypothetical protein
LLFVVQVLKNGERANAVSECGLDVLYRRKIVDWGEDVFWHG